MKVKILFPRLDCSFKPGPVPAVPGPPNHPVRRHYMEFLNSLHIATNKCGHKLEVVHLPLWQFTEEHTKDCDLVLIPHRQRYEFDVPHAMYYMQMGLPDLFSIDKDGWCADASMYPIKTEIGIDTPSMYWTSYVSAASRNESKFEQPDVQFGRENLPEKYILFPCQLPHDTVITNHSGVTAAQGLAKTMEFAREYNIPVVVKPHPINMASMAPLKAVFIRERKAGDMWVDYISIHEALKHCEAVFTVNSGGSGLEAILHKKPIFRYGRADYDAVSWDANNIDYEMWSQRGRYTYEYEQWLNTYISKHYISHKPDDFHKLFRSF